MTPDDRRRRRRAADYGFVIVVCAGVALVGIGAAILSYVGG